jgi:hypothetical protein
MADAKSISVRQITAAAKETVAKVSSQHKALQNRDRIILGFVRPPWWWIGLILREAQLESIDEAEKLASSLHSGISASAPALKSAKPSALIQDGMITVGFIAPRELETLVE